jgi:hypothetical protein
MSLKNTIPKKDISEQEIKQIFSADKNNNSKDAINKRIVKIKETDKVDKMRRPTFEMPESDYLKLKAICSLEGKDVGKTLFDIVKNWLDNIELVV